MATTTTIIDPASARELIAEYQQHNENAGEKTILTPDSVPLNGFFLDRKSLESLLSDPEVEGVSLHLAKHPDFADSEKHHFTALYTGAAPVTPTTYVSKGLIFHTTPPCPPSCTTIADA